jgi:hypothetical protein
MEALRQWERRSHGRQPEPSAGSIDSQSIKTATQSEDIGFDGNKKIKGRKRHILVDTLGLIIAVVVTSADTDRLGLVELLSQYLADGVKRLRKIWVMGPIQPVAERGARQKQTHKIDFGGHDQQSGEGLPRDSVAVGGGAHIRMAAQ